MEDAMRFHIRGPGSVPSPFRRVRPVGVGLSLLGAVGLGLAAVPNCVGGGGGHETVVRLDSSWAPLSADVAVGGVATPNCGGGGGSGDT